MRMPMVVSDWIVWEIVSSVVPVWRSIEPLPALPPVFRKRSYVVFPSAPAEVNSSRMPLALLPSSILPVKLLSALVSRMVRHVKSAPKLVVRLSTVDTVIASKYAVSEPVGAVPPAHEEPVSNASELLALETLPAHADDESAATAAREAAREVARKRFGRLFCL